MKTLIHRIAVSGLAIGLIGILATSASAQANSLFGNSSPTNTGGGTANRGSAVGGAGGGTQLQGNALTGGIGTTELGDLANTVGQGAFVGRSDNTGRFVGNANASQQTNNSQQRFRGVQNTGGRNVQPGANSGGQTRLTVRPVHRVAFSFQSRTPAKLQSALTRQFVKLASRNPRFQGLTLALNGSSEVVIRGTVKTESARRLAAAMAKLEPGVRSVKNEIVVSGN